MKFRKKPLVIEAEQFFEDKPLPFRDQRVLTLDPDGFWGVDTLEGRMVVTPGDWIVRGIKGEFYPCKPDIFEATYEPVESETASGK